MAVTLKSSKKGTSIRASGKDAQAVFDALTKPQAKPQAKGKAEAAEQRAARAAEAKMAPRRCMITIEDVDTRTGELRIDLFFEPGIKPHEYATPAVKAALHMLESAKAKSTVLMEKQG